ncbi:hypothetical protein QL285_046265 [Trifolium repens]|nr:hypothetical protein QL285_046265 [Trifolium repens]
MSEHLQMDGSLLGTLTPPNKLIMWLNVHLSVKMVMALRIQLLDNNFWTQKQKISYSSHKLTQGSTSSQLTPKQCFMQGTEVLQLSEIIKLKKDQTCPTVATTSHVRASANGWLEKLTLWNTPNCFRSL